MTAAPSTGGHTPPGPSLPSPIPLSDIESASAAAGECMAWSGVWNRQRAAGFLGVWVSPTPAVFPSVGALRVEGGGTAAGALIVATSANNSVNNVRVLGIANDGTVRLAYFGAPRVRIESGAATGMEWTSALEWAVYGVTPVPRQQIVGSRAGETAIVQQLLTALDATGVIEDLTTP